MKIVFKKTLILLFTIYSQVIFSLDEIKLGCSTSVTGINRELGSELVIGTNLYINHINNNNGIRGHRLSFTHINDWYDPNLTMQNTKRLNEELKVDILLNYSGTPTTLSILPYLKLKENENLVLFSPLSGTSAIRMSPFNDSIYNVRKSYDDEAKKIVDLLNDKNLLNVGIFYQIDGFGRSCVTSVSNYLKELDKKLISEATYKRGIHYLENKDIQAKKLLSNNLDVIITVGYYEAVAAFIRDVRKINPFIPIFNFSFSSVDSVTEILLREKTAINDLYFSQVLPHFSETKYEAINEYKDLLSQINQKPSMISLEAYLNTKILIEKLINTKQEINRDSIKSIVFSNNNYSRELRELFNKTYLYKTISEEEIVEVMIN